MNETLTSSGMGRLLQIDVLANKVSDESVWRKTCREVRTQGFDAVLTAPLWTSGADGAPADPDSSALSESRSDDMTGVLGELASVSADEGLGFFMDVVLDRAAAGGLLARNHPDRYTEPSSVLDPRAAMDHGLLYALLERGRVRADLLDDWVARLSRWLDAGVSGFRCKGLAGLGPDDWRELIEQVRKPIGRGRFLAWTPGLAAEQMSALRGAGFDATFLSLPWWDYRAGWLVQEHARLSRIAPVIALLGIDEQPVSGGAATMPAVAWRRALWTAAVAGDGLLVSTRSAAAGASTELRAVNDWLSARPESHEPLRLLGGPLNTCTAIFRSGAGVVVNPSDTDVASLNWPLIRVRLPEEYGDIELPDHAAVDTLEPAGSQTFTARRASLICPVASTAAQKRDLGLGLMGASRIAIERVQPSVDDGRFAIKATLGQSVDVEATVFMDGHDQLAVCLLWRAGDEHGWHEIRMEPLGNDRWHGSFTPTRLGRYMFAIQAWQDVWESFRIGVLKKRDAGADIVLDLREGVLMIGEAMRRAPRETPQIMSVLKKVLDSGEPDADAVLSDMTAWAMRHLDARPFETAVEGAYPVMVERRAASFSSWYELFPRSQSQDADAHGTFSDVRRRLPAIRDMGFDVLYFPPIHPIGLTNRKGRNNSLTARADDPGSPYAIGSDEGGHDAIHPQLGTLDDFKTLLQDARDHGLELALDFAIQCSPDHPWLAEHRSWFNWRADGSLRHAENPPKRYEDIVNPEFYQEAHKPKPRASLWRALRDVVLYWIEQGVRIFRVDNPHTKPLPFWEWMLGEIHARHPDVIFLSEAFTRPSMMYRLAKLGFSQSYTYFTWRNDKHELTTYLQELAAPPASTSFRPNFFVNTPDINPYFLQASGRAGFLIRAALAATLSGSWGLYSGFELCEARALPGREEYLDSEKYQLRAWDWERPGNIVAELTSLNRARRDNPALQTHLGVLFHTAHDDQVLFFSKSTPELDNIVLAAISLDPHEVHRPWIELPLQMWGLADDASVQLEDALGDAVFELRGKHHQIMLSPERPYLLWQMRRLG